MMKRSVIVVFAVMAMLMTGCTAVQTSDIKIDAEADPKANFSGYKSYAWLGSAVILNDTYGQWEPKGFDADAEIMHLIDAELRKRGMSQTTDEPDMYVAFIAGADMDALEIKESPEGDNAVLENVPQGGLLIVLIDADTGYVIWAGVATAEIQGDSDAKTAKARLDYAVSKMLKRVPK